MGVRTIDEGVIRTNDGDFEEDVADVIRDHFDEEFPDEADEVLIGYVELRPMDMDTIEWHAVKYVGEDEEDDGPDHRYRGP